MLRAPLTSPAARGWILSIGAFAAFGALAAAQAWPLPLHLATHFTGEPRGDTGVYIWNLWVFRHELLETGGTPFRTFEILSLGGPTDLSLHNYTVFSNLLALPFLSALGIARTFNLIYLLNVALSGFGAWLLIRKVTGRSAEAFVGGLLFMWSPFLVTRAAGHFSLVAAAPLPFFVLALYRAWETQRLRDAVLVGLVVVWAAFCDPYYAVYCLMIGGCFYANRVWQITLVRRPLTELRAAKHALTVAIVAVASLVAIIHVAGGGQIQLGSIRISMRTLYTPMLILTILVALRMWLATSTEITRLQWPSRGWVIRSAIATGVTVAVLMSPVLSALSSRMVKGGGVAASVPWRSSAPGVDLLSFFVPNPNHPLAPAALSEWLGRGSPNAIEEVASLSLVGLLLLVAAWRVGARLPKFWIAITAGFALLALGPFISVAHINTYIPTPWAVLRYVPLVGAARIPARMDVVVMLGFAVLVASSLVALTSRFPAKRRLILCAAGVAIAFELFPAPRRLYSAEIPKVYEIVANDPRPVRVLRLPTGIKDGLSNIGNFGPQAQYYQTFHHKGLIGGYLSRVDPSSKQFYRRLPMMSALMQLSEGRQLEAWQVELAKRNADNFLQRSRIGYVVWRNSAISPELRTFAIDVLRLTKVAEADGYELYAPRPGP